MLLFARGTHDAEDLRVEDLAAEIKAKSAHVLQEAGCRLMVTDEAPHAVIRGSRSLLVGLFENLINNGVQMCGRGGELSLRIGGLGSDRVEFAVADNGPGIPEEVKERIFEPFFTTRNQGTGLGLAIVRAIARDHRATVDVESSSGSGTVFKVSFPAVCRGRNFDPMARARRPADAAIRLP